MQVEAVPEHEANALESLRIWIETYTGINYKKESALVLYSRLQQLCLQENIPDLNTLQAYLNNGRMGHLSLKIAQSVSTTHTHFYRESEAFELLFKHVQTLQKESQIRIWSAASSSGQEAYTMAIYLCEALGLQQAQQRVRILGTDINATMIRQAEIGLYTREQVKSVPEHLLDHYFTVAGMGQYQISSKIRQMCTFRRINLKTQPWPFQQQFHVVFCRNVLYYFQKEQQAEIVNAIYQHTVKGGCLMTSVTESLSQLPTPWKKRQTALFYKESS